MIQNIFGAMPTIPTGLMHEMFKINQGKELDVDNGGQWMPTRKEDESFQGVILPVGSEDLVRAEGGSTLNCTEKIYTNGFVLDTGAKVYDPQSGHTYTVSQELGHNSLHPMKRYLIERKGKAGKA